MSHANGQFEDDGDVPLFLKFSRFFKVKSLFALNRQVREFEAKHPKLALVSIDEFTERIPVTAKYLFSDNSHRYAERLYEFKVFKEIRYYRPDSNLAKWLTMVDEFAEYRKLQKVTLQKAYYGQNHI